MAASSVAAAAAAAAAASAEDAPSTTFVSGDESGAHDVVDPQTDEGCLPWKVEAVKAAVASGLLTEEAPVALFYNLTRFRQEAEAVRAAFPEPHFVHTLALKSNPVMPLLKVAREAGLGFEAASHGELFQALRATADRDVIVFDSPVKTRAELSLALRESVYINCDNFQELAVLAELVDTDAPAAGSDATSVEGGASKPPAAAGPARLGLRLNPQVGTGSMDVFSTAGKYSKFGVGHDQLEDVLAAYAQHRWLRGIHVHVGSQGCPVALTVAGIRRTVDVALEVNRRAGYQQVEFVDIGGGLAVNLATEEQERGDLSVSPKAMADALRESVPELFDGTFPVVITEYGRRYSAKCGFLASRVEYAKRAGGRNIAAIHAGADLFTRYIYHPKEWRLRATALDSSGERKAATEPREQQDISGPCCIAGDVVAARRALPLLNRGDHVVLHDTGAYVYSAFSYYNSRQTPPILAFTEDDVAGSLHVLKPGVTVEETCHFFGDA